MQDMDDKSLYDLYIKQRLSTRQIAAMVGVNQKTVSRWLDKAGIPARPKTENKMPTPKGGHHSWGSKISEANKDNPNVGQGNAGKYGAEAPNWKGGEITDPSGHIKVWVRERHSYIQRSHLVWLAAHPGGVIGKGYVIHHINRQPADDRPENLERLSIVAHGQRHGKDRHKVAVPVISAQGRTGRPSKGESRAPEDAADVAIFAAIYKDHGPTEAAREYGVSRQTILNWLDRYGIVRAGRTEASEMRRKAASAASWRSTVAPVSDGIRCAGSQEVRPQAQENA